ncbi:MAG TPA: Asp23/Gls24 family envelope stress response protein [Mycobacteriales bacterium]|jgi:uncharacterized alkaline shock family protein YloU
MTGTRGDQVPCGATIDDLIAQVADGDATRRTPHQQGCVHCQAALTEYARLWDPVTVLAAEHVQPPDSLIDEALRRIRTTLEHPEYGLLPGGPDGLTRIAVRVIIVTARTAAERTDGVRAALTHAAPSDSSATVAAGITGSSTAIEVTVAATYGHDLPALADRIRRTVAHDIRTYTGLRPADITIVIDDILQP